MINWRDKFKAGWRRALGGAAACFLLGVAALLLADRLVILGYDLLFHDFLVRFQPRKSSDDLVLIYMDDQSFRALKQKSIHEWDPTLHAQLLDRLTADGAKLVVFDVTFTDKASDEAKARLAQAIRRNTNVVLAASLDQRARPQIQAKGPVLPWDELLDAGANHGISTVLSPPGATAREYHPGTEYEPSLPWVAAQLVGAEITRKPGARQPTTWLNYYGPANSLRHISYTELDDHPAGYFRNKIVFVGARPTTLKPYEEADLFPTPHRLWRGEYFAGVEIGATAFLNLLNNDGLVMMPAAIQWTFILVSGIVFGGLLVFLGPWKAAGVSLLGIAGCIIAAFIAAQQHVWFGWTVIAFVQIPCGLAWSLGSRATLLKFEKEVLAQTLEKTTKLVEATKATVQAAKPAQMIPDHTLVKRVGKGAYGEVWLARNAVGVYHAAKIVQRRGFPADEPYEREFRGLQKFMPISRSHPGFVHILHAGRHDDERYFFCIMEAGDDQTSGQRINPDSYSPKTLATELEWRGKLAPEECLRLGLALTLALEHLHQHGLIHRDIKPANIIYVNGAPKFADIGLVTEIRSASHDVSFLGTEGYLAPEGPGTASADAYALGKVLYEASMGRDRRLFPEVPTSVLEQPSDTLVRQLNEVIFKACETAPYERYQTAGEMHADLLRLQVLASQQSR